MTDYNQVNLHFMSFINLKLDFKFGRLEYIYSQFLYFFMEKFFASNKFIFISILYIFLCNNLYATKYYVDPSSPVSISNGTITNPWKTITEVNNGTLNLLPGDSVLFKRGQSFSGRLIIAASGTFTKPIVYTSYGTGNMPEFTHSTTDVISITNKQNIIIDGFKIIDKTMSITDHSITAKISYGIVLNNAPYCTISNCEITLVGVGIAATEGSDFTTISGNNIYNLRAVRNTIGGDDDYGANAMVIGTSTNKILNNRFEGCWALSYDYGYDGGAVEFYGSTISDNVISNNSAINCNGFIEIGSGNYGIATNNLVSYNKIINCGQLGTFHNKLDGFAIRTDNLKFYNNVIVETKKQFSAVSSLFWYADPTKVDVVILKNNIIWLTTGENVVNNNQDTLKMVHTNNIYKLRNGILGVKLGASELLLGNQKIFVDTTGDPENWDFRTIAGSPAINFGTNVGLTRDFIGNPIVGNPDAGIYEYVTTRSNKFYVDPSSKSTIADGSIVSPWKTIAQLNTGTTSITAGDTVFFKRGQLFSGSVVVGGSGTASQPIVYTAYGTGNMPELTHSTTDVIFILNKQYIVLDGLRVIDKTMDSADHSITAKISYGIIIQNSPNCTVKNCEITLVGMGIAVMTGSNFTTITKNKFYNFRSVRNTVGGTDDYGGSAVVLGSASNEVSYNLIQDCWAKSYDYGFSGGAIKFFNSAVNDNKVIYNTAINCYDFLGIGGTSNGSSLNNLIAYNKIINCGRTAALHNRLGDGSYMNIVNTQFYNNVIIENKIQFNPASAMFWFADPTKVDVVTLRNNIIWLTTGENFVSNNYDTLKMIHTNNIFKIRNGILGVRLNATELSLPNDQIFADTLGDPLNWDYRLLPGSPGINFGTNVGFTQDYIGNPIIANPDAGIYEIVALPPTPAGPSKYYVDPSSTSTITNGTITNPWKTIAQLNAGTITMVAGDSVFLRRGQTFTGTIIVGGSGTESKPIVYTSYGTGNIPILTNTTSDVISIVNRQYIIIDGFKIIDQTMSTTDHSILAKISYGIIVDGSPYCIIRNCDISLIGIGIALMTGSNFTTINNNNIYNMRAVVNTVGGADDYGANSMVLGSSNNSITNNKISDCWATSYDYGYLGGAIELFNSLINNNKIMYNTFNNCSGFLELGGESAGYAINNLVAYNKIINCGQTATVHNRVDGSFINVTNLRIFNNVIVETKKQFNPVSSMFWYADPSIIDIVILRNNIIWLTTGENVVNNNLDTTKLVHVNNIYKLVGGNLGVNLNSNELLLGNTSIFTDTSGDPINWNFNTSLSSPAINFGEDVGLIRDFIGNPIIGRPDAGIFENPTENNIQPLVATLLADSIKCNGSVVSVSVRATGGIAPYTGTGLFIVPAGTYTYIITDAVGKKDTVSITLTQPNKLILNITAGIAKSILDTTRITATTSGGVFPYTYRLNEGTYQSSNIFTNITPATYNITVKDANTCTLSDSIKVNYSNTPTPILEATIQYNPIKCYGGTTIVTISATGGKAPYTGTGTFTVYAGIYSQIVTDALGVKDTINVTITQPTQLKLSITSGLITSSNSTTYISSTASGGTSPYSYQLNSGLFQASGNFYNVYAGTYTVTVKDANTCSLSQSITIIATNTTPEINKRLLIYVYPNPTTNYFTVSTLKYKGSFVTINLKVYNLFGQIVYTAQGMSNVNYTFGSSFLSGTYTLVAVVDGTVQAVQLIKL